MVRGLKAGLPVSDAMKVIAGESPAPVGPEFFEVVEGQRVGIAIDQGIERMFDRMPLAEVNFLEHRHGHPVEDRRQSRRGSQQSLESPARPQEDEAEDRRRQPGGQGLGR